MKMPSLLSRKFPRMLARRKLRAATTRHAPAKQQEYAEEEPNVRLASAFAVVLVLHIVAVGGIYAFNSIKAHQPAAENTTQQATPTKSDETEQTPAGATGVPIAAKTYRVKAGDTLTKIALANGVSVDDLEEANGLKSIGGLRLGQELKIPAKQAPKQIGSETHKSTDMKSGSEAVVKNVSSSSGLKDSGKTYTVVKGDNLAAIAKRLKVGYEELLKLNKVDDPKKLQIGQELKIPAKHN
jgi:LysM repeat protein